MSTAPPKKRKDRKAPRPVWDQVVDEAVPDSPAEKSIAKRTKRWRYFVWASVILLPIALLGDLALLGSHTATKTSMSGAVSSPGEAVAWQTVRSWLAETPSPLPDGKIVAWQGATPVPTYHAAKHSSAAGGAVYTAEIDRFVLTGREKRIYEVSVEVATSPDGSAVAVSGPSLTPGPSNLKSPSVDGPWPGLTATANVPSAVTQAIDGWAQAYTSGSPSKLHLAVGDPNQGAYFAPLYGVSSVTATPTWAAPVGAPSAGAMTVEVTLNITWKGQSSGTTGNSGVSGSTASPPQTTLDLLVERANSAAPVVVSWGPPGTGPTLTPYHIESN